MIENDKYKGYIRRYWSESFYGASIEFAKGCEVRFPKLLDKHGTLEYNKLENEYEKAREDLPYFVKELVTNE